MFRIGEFSKIARVTTRQLRYYDECALLQPAQIDNETGYRYYSASQLPRLHQILAMRLWKKFSYQAVYDSGMSSLPAVSQMATVSRFMLYSLAVGIMMNMMGGESKPAQKNVSNLI